MLAGFLFHINMILFSVGPKRHIVVHTTKLKNHIATDCDETGSKSDNPKLCVGHLQ